MATDLTPIFGREHASKAYRDARQAQEDRAREAADARLNERYACLLDQTVENIQRLAMNAESQLEVTIENARDPRLENAAMDKVMETLQHEPYNYPVEKKGMFWSDREEGTYSSPTWIVRWA